MYHGGRALEVTSGTLMGPISEFGGTIGKCPSHSVHMLSVLCVR